MPKIVQDCKEPPMSSGICSDSCIGIIRSLCLSLDFWIAKVLSREVCPSSARLLLSLLYHHD